MHVGDDARKATKQIDRKELDKLLEDSVPEDQRPTVRMKAVAVLDEPDGS